MHQASSVAVLALAAILTAAWVFACRAWQPLLGLDAFSMGASLVLGASGIAAVLLAEDEATD
jgi:hypothetical protein